MRPLTFMFDGNEIEWPAVFQDRIPVGHDLAQNAQAGHAAIWENPQADMGEAMIIVDGESILAVSLQR